MVSSDRFWRNFVTFRHRILFLFLVLFSLAVPSFAQVDSVVGQISNSGYESFAGGISGNGRFVVFESRANLATENPRNSDGNLEIFLFDYAQRRIFQITDTKSVYYDDRATTLEVITNIRVAIVNTRPVISNDGRWIAFSSNATSSTPAVPNSTNPGLFDGNAFTSPTPTPTPPATPTPTPNPTPSPGGNPLTLDGNLEIWVYEIPAYAPVANLSAGDEIPFTQLAGGTFTRVTNTPASQMPRPGSSASEPVVADDNHDASISDDGSVIAFGSTRDLVPCVGNPFSDTPPFEDNEEIFTYVRGAISQCTDPQSNSVGIRQVTKTLRGPITNPIYSKNPAISGNGLRVAFTSTGDDPIDNPASTTNFDTGSNPESSRNEEIFYADLLAGVPQSSSKQITTTTSAALGDPVNIFERGGRISRDGRLIAFDSYAEFPTTPNPGNQTSQSHFGLYVYDTATSTFRLVAPRSNADSAASGGDISRYPGFTDYPDGCVGPACVPNTLVLETRLNIKPDGTIPATASDGLNPDKTRPSQLYSYPLNVAPASATFTRLAKFPEPFSLLASTQPIPSNSLQRMTFNLALSELGTGNFDSLSEVYYLLKPPAANTQTTTMTFSTGATRQRIQMLPTPTPTPSPSPPVTPSAVLGMSPQMLAIVNFQSRLSPPVAPLTATGSVSRQFNLPIELGGITVSINGAACGIKSVDQTEIVFVVPLGLASNVTGTDYPITINNNGTLIKGTVTIIPTRPDIFRSDGVRAPGGRAKLFNVVNSVHTTEPFAVRTIKRRGNMLVPTILRIYMTGVAELDPTQISVKIHNQVITPASTRPVMVEPGIFTFDFVLPRALEGAGNNRPVVVTVTGGGATFESRLEDTTSLVWIL